MTQEARPRIKAKNFINKAKAKAKTKAED